MSKRVHILMAGPIRPTIGYVARLISTIKKELYEFDVKTHLVTWNTLTGGSDTVEVLKALFDFTHCIDEPNDDSVYDKNIQTVQMRTEINHMTIHEKKRFITGMYKMYYSYRHLVCNCDIPSDDVVIRIRTDLYIQPDGFDVIKNIVHNCLPNTIYIRPNRGCKNMSDWFAISKYSTFKQTYYIENDEQFKNIAEHSYNAEEIIVNNAKTNNVTVQSIEPHTLILRVCREFANGHDTLDHHD